MIIHDSHNESVVKMDRLYFNKLHFSRTDDTIIADDLKIQFTKSYNFNDDHTICIVGLGCTVKSKDDQKINLEASIIGHFACVDASPELRDNLLKKNSIAILFPYLRSQISLLTTQPELSPITLPPMNIEAVFENASES